MAFTPEDFATLQDPEFHKFVAEQMGFPQKPKETGGFWAGVKTAGGSQLQGVGQLAADFGWENNPIEAYGKQVQENNQLRTQSLGDIVENPWQALKEGTGMAVGYLAPGLVGRGLQVAGGAAKLAGLSRAGNALNAGVTQGALAALPSYGGIREEQGDTDSWTDKAVAGLGAAAVGAIENQFGAQRLLGIGRGANAAAVPTKAEFVSKLGATPIKSGLKEFGRVVGAEMGEELAQNPIEQMSAYQNPLTAENIHESLFGAAMAGLGTLGLGGAGGARMGMRHAGLEKFRQQDLLNPNTPLDTLEDQAQWNRAFIERDQGAAAGQQFYDTRQQEIDAYTESLVDPYRRQAFADQMRSIDILADQERIAARAPSRMVEPSQNFLNGQNDRLPNFYGQTVSSYVPGRTQNGSILTPPGQEYADFWNNQIYGLDDRPLTDADIAARAGETPDMFGGRGVSQQNADDVGQQTAGVLPQGQLNELLNAKGTFEAALRDKRFAADHAAIADQLARINQVLDTHANAVNPNQMELRPHVITANDLSLGDPNMAHDTAWDKKTGEPIRRSITPGGSFDYSGTLANINAATVQQLVPIIQNGGQSALTQVWDAALTSRNPENLHKVVRALRIAEEFRSNTAKKAQGKNATQTQPVAAQATATTQQKAQPKPAAAPAAQGVKQSKTVHERAREIQSQLDGSLGDGLIDREVHAELTNRLVSNPGAHTAVASALSKAVEAKKSAGRVFDNEPEFVDHALLTRELPSTGFKGKETELAAADREAFLRYYGIGEFSGNPVTSFDSLAALYPKRTEGKGKGELPSHESVRQRLKQLKAHVDSLRPTMLSIQNVEEAASELTPGETVEPETQVMNRALESDTAVEQDDKARDVSDKTGDKKAAVGAAVSSRAKDAFNAYQNEKYETEGLDYFGALPKEIQVSLSDAYVTAHEAKVYTKEEDADGKKQEREEQTDKAKRAEVISAYSEELEDPQRAVAEKGKQEAAKSKGRAKQKLEAKDETGMAVLRGEALAKGLAAGDTSAASALQELLEGQHGAKLAQLLRRNMAMPKSVKTPQDIVDFINSQRADAVAEQKAQFAEAGKLWGEGFDTLPEAAKLDFVNAMNGLGDLINTPAILRQIKGEIQNEHLHGQAGEDAAGIPSGDAQRPAGGRDDEGPGTGGADQSAVPVVSKKKRRVAVSDEAAGRSDTEGQAGEVTRQRKNRLSTLTESVEDGEVKDVLDAIVENYAAEGRASMLDNVRDIGVHDKPHDEINYNHEDGTYSILIGQASIKNGRNHILMGVEHEVAHALDDFYVGPQYSDTPMMGVLVAQSRKMYADYANGNKDNVLGEIMQYPFTDKYDSQRTRQEVFAQLMSIYSVESLRAELKKQSPVAYNFIKGVHDAEKAKQAGNTAAKVQRKDNSPDQSGDGKRFRKGTAERISGGTFSKIGEKLDELVSDPRQFFSELKLGFTTLEQIAEATKSAAVNSYHKAMVAMQMKEKDIVHKASQIDLKWAEIAKDSAVFKRLNSVMTESTLAEYDPSKAKPTNDRERAIFQDWNLLPKEAKDQYVAVRKFYEDNLELRKSFMEDLEKKAKLQGKELDQFRQWYAKVKGPYFPLVRIGDYYAVGMSKRAAELMDKKRDGLLSSAEEAELSKLRKDPKHYTTSSFNSLREAKKWVKDNAGTYHTTRFNKSEEKFTMGDLNLPGLPQLEAYINAEMPAEIRGEVRDMIAKLAFEMAPESSHLKRMMNREGVAGYEQDMRKAFAASSISQAHYISRLMHNQDVSAALQEVRNEGRDDLNMRNVYNELVKRAKLASTPDTTGKIVTGLTNVSYLAHLGLSPAFVLTNMTQVPMITTPWLGARHGFTRAASEIAKAYGEAFNIINTSYKEGGYQTDLHWGKLFKPGSDIDKMLTTLRDRNVLEITMEHDLGVVANMGGTSKLSDVNKMLNTPVRATEYANRVVTALAAYRLAIADKKSHDEAVEHAAKAVSQTQLNYSELNAPRLMRTVLGSKSLAKVVFQFRKYQQGMLWLVASNVGKAFSKQPDLKGDALKAWQQERSEARRFTLGIFGLMQLMAGTTGLPFIGSIGFLANMVAAAFGDDDDPWDWETELRNFYHDAFGKEVGDILSKGILMGVSLDMSTRIGMGNLASPLPFARSGNSGRETVGNVLTAAGGAPVGTIVDTIDGLKLLATGDGAKAAEKLVPLKAAKDMLKGYRYADEGMTDTRGNVVLPPEKFDAWDIALRSTGFTPEIESTYYAANEAVQSAKFAASDKRHKLIQAYSRAQLDGEDVNDIREKIAAFNERHPEKGVRIDHSALIKSTQAMRKLAAGRNDAGIRDDKATAPFMDRARFATE